MHDVTKDLCFHRTYPVCTGYGYEHAVLFLGIPEENRTNFKNEGTKGYLSMIQEFNRVTVFLSFIKILIKYCEINIFSISSKVNTIVCRKIRKPKVIWNS